jgi:hypothetical protein
MFNPEASNAEGLRQNPKEGKKNMEGRERHACDFSEAG